MAKFLVMVAIATTLMMVLTSCSLFPREAPLLKQKRIPTPVADCYGRVLNARDNSIALGALKGEELWCEGIISERMPDGVQFKINEISLEDLRELKLPEDQYLVCKAAAREQLEYLGKGAHVVFKGTLSTAFPNRVPLIEFFGKSYEVEFDNCLFWDYMANWSAPQ